MIANSQIGATYNPVNVQLKLPAITTTIANCQLGYDNWIAKLTTYKTETDKREIAFLPVDKLVTAINQSVQQLNEPQQTFNDIQAIVSKIHGSTKKIKSSNANKLIDPTIPAPIPDPTDPIVDPISTSQQSYDSIITNLDKLIKRLQTIPTYAPNENELKLTSLQTLYTSLNTVNSAAGNVDFALSLARNQRNLTFYAPQTGMYDITIKIKKYIRSNSAISPAIYGEVTKLKFVKFVQRKKKSKK